jgi:glycosyltransferase involved in cell wall biosynthesis
MLIGIEAERANNPQKTGVEHYAKELILHLAELDKINSYILYLRSKPEGWFQNLPANFQVKVIPFPIFWTQIRISLEMLFSPVDVLFIPASALPLIHPKKSVVTIHDIGWRYFPRSFTWFMRNFLEWSTKFAIRNAAGIIAVSESTKKDLIKFYGIKANRVSVVHHGYEIGKSAKPASPDPSRSVPASTRLSLGGQGHADASQGGPESQSLGTGLPNKYILFLSTLQPRKNLEGLINAFKQLKIENPELPHKLVVVGKTGWKFESILKTIAENKDVIYLNYVPDRDRFAILAKANMLVLPSFYEGFGMQILESFQAGVPVATSNVSSMPEVAGHAALYFDPKNITEIKNAMKLILTDKSLADNLRAMGKERLKDFSWEKCARETLEVLSKI